MEQPDHLRLDARFTDHPATPEQIERYKAVRAAGLLFAATLAELCPPSPERTLAINDVDSAVMKANAAIARTA